MNVTINGYISFNCSDCGESHTLEAQSCRFEEDVSEEAADEDYVRYISKIDTPCSACSNRIVLNVDVWEYPAAAVNYSYYGEEGADKIQCELSIEHYFDDQGMKEEDRLYEEPDANSAGLESENEDDEDDYEGEGQYAAPPLERYMDQYDDDD